VTALQPSCRDRPKVLAVVRDARPVLPPRDLHDPGVGGVVGDVGSGGDGLDIQPTLSKQLGDGV